MATKLIPTFYDKSTILQFQERRLEDAQEKAPEDGTRERCLEDAPEKAPEDGAQEKHPEDARKMPQTEPGIPLKLKSFPELSLHFKYLCPTYQVQACSQGGVRGVRSHPPQTAEVHFFVKKWGPGRPPRTPPQTAEVHFFLIAPPSKKSWLRA